MNRYASLLNPLLQTGGRCLGLALALTLGGAPAAVQAETAAFTLHAEQPALARSKAGNWDSAYLDPGAVVFHQDAFHMFYVAIPKWPHPLAIGYAKSTDGLTWERQSDAAVLTPELTGDLGATSIMSTSALVTEAEEWVVYFTSATEGENFYGHVGRATAPGPLGPWAVDPAPVLSPGPDGAWDSLSVGDASVVKTETGYAMYYAGFGNFKNGAFAEKRANIGMATSPDGIQWTKYDDPSTTEIHFSGSDPVLSVSTDTSSWDTFRVLDPNVQKTADGWIMSYRGATFETPLAVGLATSTDGLTWDRASDAPILENTEAGKSIVFINLVSRPERDLLYLEMGSTNQTDAYVATRQRLTD